MKEEIMKPATKFNLVQTKILQVNSILSGYSSFVPITFEREFTSLAICTLHGSLIDFRFRVKNNRHNQEENNDTFMENGILVERKYVEEN
jgi:hypothetical protein